jgi:hypothetical protein
MGAKGPAWVRANRDYVLLSKRVERLFASVLEPRWPGRAPKKMAQPTQRSTR